MSVVSLRDVEPSAIPFVVEGIIPADNFVSLLFGEPGSQKSFLALWIATHVVAGTDVFGRRIETPGPVLWIDSEQSQKVMVERAWMVARGCGLDAPPSGLFYLRLDESLTSDAAVRVCRDAIRAVSPVLVVLDSLGESADVDPQDSKGIKRVVRTLRGFGAPVLAIDHVAVSSRGRTTARPIGSGAKDAAMRSGLYVRRKGDAVIIRPTKASYGEIASPIALRTSFDGDAYRVTPVAQGEPTPHRSAPVSTRLLAYLSEPRTVDDVAAELRIARRTAMNRLGELRRDGKARKVEGERWVAAA